MASQCPLAQRLNLEDSAMAGYELACSFLQANCAAMLAYATMDLAKVQIPKLSRQWHQQDQKKKAGTLKQETSISSCCNFWLRWIQKVGKCISATIV